MRIALFANARSGRGAPADELDDLLARAGHTVVQRLDPHWSLSLTLDGSADMVAAAGGDGTVAAAARAIARTPIPLGILPMGTANNVAAGLGISGTLDEIARGWHGEKRAAVDLGRVATARGEYLFLESVGGGLVPAVIESMDAQPTMGDDAALMLTRANARYRAIAADLPSREWTMVVDGERVEGRFLLVEVLNSALLGPNLRLSPEASPTDGLLSVVAIREEQRSELNAFLHAHEAGSATSFAFPAAHGRRVDLTAAGDIHIDDAVFAWNTLGYLQMDVLPGALTIIN